MQQVIKKLTEKELTPLKQELAGWKYNDELLLFKNWIYIPANLELKQKLLKLYYDLPLQGHPGIFGTIANIQRYFW